MFGTNGGDVGIGLSGPINLDAANNIIRVIHKFTKDYSTRVSSLVARLENKSNLNPEVTAQIENEVGNLIEQWNQKIRKLGGNPKGLWLVDIDAGDGYYCWKYPEPEVCFWHEYKSGYTGRISIDDRAGSVKTVPYENSLSAD